MSWTEDTSNMARQCNEAFGEPFSYSDPETASVTLIGPVSAEEEVLRVNTLNGTELHLVRYVYVLMSDQIVRKDATFFVQGNSYNVESIGDLIGERVKVKLVRTKSVEKTRKKYRG